MRSLKYLILILLLSTSSSIYSQQRVKREDKSGFYKFQVQVLTKMLELNKAEAEKFDRIYTEYSEKMDSLHLTGGNVSEKRAETMNENDVEAHILKSFEVAEQMSELKREYYSHFRTIMTAKQVLKMYNTENRLRERLTAEYNKRLEGSQKDK